MNPVHKLTQYFLKIIPTLSCAYLDVDEREHLFRFMDMNFVSVFIFTMSVIFSANLILLDLTESLGIS
jgi:hypothetical protein